ncbi:MAG: ABC transporter substrate-binding protein [Gemmatimonadaceae bacterium]|nr:ABC transporter substrate-binding protein [Gemmatimonadaceae bacterium]
MPSLRSLRLIPLLTLAACGGGSDATPAAREDSPGGTVVVSTPAEPDNLIPPLTTSLSGRQVEDLVFQHLANIGPALNTVGDVGFTPDLALRWAWSADSLSIAFDLDPAARWHDGAPVRARDVAFSYALYVDPKTASPTAALLTNIDSVTVRDSLTAVVWFKARKPEQFFDVAYQLYILPSHLLSTADRATLAASPLATQPVGSGPFRMARWVPKQVLELSADTTGGRRRAQLDRVVFTVAPDPVTAFTRVATGEADLYEAVRPDKVADVATSAQLRLVLMPSLEYSYLGFNLVDPKTGKPHPIFGDRAVRRALTMATDRRSIVANIYDSLAIQARGPFTVALASADPTLKPLPYAVDSANALLDAAGWLRGADSLRRRNGAVLGFGILVPSTSVPRMRAAVLLQEQFRRIGADVQVQSSDIGGFLSKLTARTFDTVLGAWAPDPGPGSVRDTWGSSGAGKGGNNHGAYRSVAFDAQVDSGLAAFAPAEMQAHFAAAWRIIADDAPAIWLAEPKRAMAVHSRIETTGMRPDAWWAGLAQWRIPAARRIARDAGAAAAPATAP